MPILEEQFLALYDKNVEKIYRYIFFRVGAEETARDLTSEVFLKSWQYFNKTPGEKSHQVVNPRAFIYQIARNLIVDFYRQNNRLPISLDEIADKTFADKKNDPAELILHSLEMETVRGALTNLSDDYQEIIIWRYLDEMEIREIAEILNKSEGAVRVLLSRALNSLKSALKSQEKKV